MMGTPTRRAMLAGAAMAAAAAAAAALTPRRHLADLQAPPDLEREVPDRLADWRTDPDVRVAVVDRRRADTLERIYSQVLNRSYVNGGGERVMLSLTYGPDQRKDMALHYPEVCYPAQGFSVRSNRLGVLLLSQGRLPVRRLETSLGTQRPEPVTYWTTVGAYHSLDALDRRLIELRYGLHGLIPDGFLVRISSIGLDSPREFARHERFVRTLLQALTPSQRSSLTGMPLD